MNVFNILIEILLAIVLLFFIFEESGIATTISISVILIVQEIHRQRLTSLEINQS